MRHTPTGERGHPMPAGSTGTIVGYAAQGWAIVRWDRGGQALTHPGDITSDESPPPTTGAGSAQRK
ncbi:hypothetical protein PJI21_05585 [Mycobacterium kansasii]|uniref:hypothetical protein n=1 Tax=Mycobacterium kansasii TaxID=1768 RepID=UPI00115DD76C|nr:hypothetical protein [Mycobacterium kansasii]